MTLHVPLDRISGIKLDDDQYSSYISVAGQLAKQQLLPLVSSPGWENIPKAFRTSLVREIIRKSRTFAQEVIKAKSIGSDNDIVKQSLQKKFEGTE